MSAKQTSRRAAILRATVDEVVKNGFDGTSIQRIAESAGVSTGLVMYHFKTKEDLVNTAWIEARRHFTERVSFSENPPKGLERVEESFRVLFVDRDEGTAPWDLWLELWAKAARSPMLSDLHAEQLEEVRAGYTQRMLDAIEKGELRDGIDPQLAGDLLHTLIYGLAVKVTLDSKIIPPERAFEIAKLAIDLLNKEGLGAAPEGPRHGANS